MGVAISLNKTESLDAVLDDFSEVDIDVKSKEFVINFVV
jgi:hypothetical protein